MQALRFENERTSDSTILQLSIRGCLAYLNSPSDKSSNACVLMLLGAITEELSPILPTVFRLLTSSTFVNSAKNDPQVMVRPEA